MESYEEIYKELAAKLEGWFRDFIQLLPNLVLAILVVVVFGFLARLIEKGVRRGIRRLTNHLTICDLFATLARLVTIAVGTFIALELLHLDKTVTSLIAGVGVLGLALGFAFQDIAANFVSGIIMVFRRPFEDGDLVEIGGETGHIQKIELRATLLKTFEGLTVTLPNKEVFQSKIINYTRTPERRVDVEVGVAYSDDLRKARDVATKAVAAYDERDRSRDVEVFFTGFGDSSINFVLRFWLSESEQVPYLKARSEAIILIKEAFDESGITIPFPIRTLDFGAGEVGGVPLGDTALKLANGE
ncbi:MAG: mechanosensitive ion channel family protein [Nannocystaceae bacterium]